MWDGQVPLAGKHVYNKARGPKFNPYVTHGRNIDPTLP